MDDVTRSMLVGTLWLLSIAATVAILVIFITITYSWIMFKLILVAAGLGSLAEWFRKEK